MKMHCLYHAQTSAYAVYTLIKIFIFKKHLISLDTNFKTWDWCANAMLVGLSRYRCISASANLREFVIKRLYAYVVFLKVGVL